MPSGKLYTYPGNFRAYKAQIAAKYSGFDLKVPSDFVFGETNKQNSFTQKFPFGKVPAFEDADGTCLFESNAIAWHVADDKLRGISGIKGAPTTSSGAAQVIQWMSFADNELLPAVCSWTFPVQGIIPANVGAGAMQRAREELSALLHALNQHLLTRTYLAAEWVTLADVVVCCTLLPAFQLVLDPEFRKPFGNVLRWFNTVVNQPHVKSVLGEVELCSQAASLKGASTDKAKEKKPKQENQKPKQAKQEKPKKQEKSETEEVVAPPPKPSDPFASHPKSAWIMDDFKRFYSNNDEDKSIDYFWQHFDKENFSIWYCEYKYNDELTRTFMTLNLISGMFQRLGNLRKNAFASMCIFGEDNNMSVSGLWVWRGHDLVFTLSPDWSVEYDTYDWKKLDVNAEETKALVRKYFKWEGTDSAGRAFNDGEIYK